jgi:GDP-4-dehydro-6-deoxy-D-mannose reductase
MRALVTGVRGFCGAHLVSRLRKESGTEIAGLDRLASTASDIHLDAYFQADITSREAVAEVIRTFRPDWIFHLAGLSGNGVTASSLYDANINGTLHLLESVRMHVPDATVLLVGSAAEYGPIETSALPVTESTTCQPVGAYGTSKYAATLTGMDYARSFNLNVIIARPFNIVGAGVPASLVVGAMISRAKKALMSAQPTMKVGDFESQRDFIAVSDVVDAYLRLVRANLRMEIFNICSGQTHSIRSIAEMLVANSHIPIRLEFDPNLVPASPVRVFYGSFKKAAQAVGFKPTISIDEALRESWCSEMEMKAFCE